MSSELRRRTADTRWATAWATGTTRARPHFAKVAVAGLAIHRGLVVRDTIRILGEDFFGGSDEFVGLFLEGHRVALGRLRVGHHFVELERLLNVRLGGGALDDFLVKLLFAARRLVGKVHR